MMQTNSAFEKISAKPRFRDSADNQPKKRATLRNNHKPEFYEVNVNQHRQVK